MKRILAKVNSTSFIKQQEGIDMLRAQISHMQKRNTTNAMHSDGEGQCKKFDVLAETIRKTDPFTV